MLIKVFSLTFSSASGDFDDSPIQDFIKDKEVISIRDYLFVRNEVPYLTVVIKYFPYRQEIVTESSSSKGKRDESWEKMLTESDMGLFNLLRDWRSKRCKKEGVPPYILLTNKQLAEIVKRRPQTTADLIKIDGIGKTKAEKFGLEILEISKIDSTAATTPAEANVS